MLRRFWPHAVLGGLALAFVSLAVVSVMDARAFTNALCRMELARGARGCG